MGIFQSLFSRKFRKNGSSAFETCDEYINTNIYLLMVFSCKGIYWLTKGLIFATHTQKKKSEKCSRLDVIFFCLYLLTAKSTIELNLVEDIFFCSVECLA